MNIVIKSVLVLLTPAITMSACKKLTDVDAPVDQVISTEVFKTDSTAQSAVLGIYSEMMASGSFMSGTVTFYTGLSANELTYYTPGSRDEFANCDLDLGSHAVLNTGCWNPAYKYIYAANLCLERLSGSNISPALKDILTGEVLFLRAFCYFQLINLFGDVPFITSTDYRTTAKEARTPIAVIYDQLVKDLKLAAEMLPAVYTGVNRVRATKWAALGLLARMHLYLQQWEQAADAADAVIKTNLFALSPLPGVFLKNSSETILQLMPVNPGWNTWESRELLPATANETPKYIITERLIQAFEAGDNRRNVWVGTRVFNGQTIYYPAKYKAYANTVPVTEFYMALRLAEQYLIRSEARAHLSNLEGGLADLNVIRRRANLPDIAATDKEELLQLIERERQSELFAEWGHRWFDLKRTNRINDVMGAIHPGTWHANDALYPIPADQLNFNPNLTQNPGY